MTKLKHTLKTIKPKLLDINSGSQEFLEEIESSEDELRQRLVNHNCNTEDTCLFSKIIREMLDE